MKPLSIILFFFLAVAFTFCASNKNCTNFRTGKFSHFSKTAQLKFYFHRNDSIQTETDPITGNISTFKISWPTPCEYILSPLSKAQGIVDKTDSFFYSKPLRFTIAKATSSYYIFRTQVDSIGKTMYVTDTIFVENQ